MSAEYHRSKPEVAILFRRFEERDIAQCGRIHNDAFRHIARKYGASPDVPAVEVSIAVLERLWRNPGFYGFVAEREGVIIGSNWLDERNVIAGIGPISVDPLSQDSGVGRQLMDVAIARSDEQGFPGVRLVQAAYHTRSLSLYTKLGFVSREELAVVDGEPKDRRLDSYSVRLMELRDLTACNDLCASAHGFNREIEVRDAIEARRAFIAERDGAIRGYTTGLGYFGHSVGENTEAICALLARAPRLKDLGALVPVRNYPLFRWCLDHGMRVMATMTLMSRGIYQEPAGAYLPSILY